MLLLPPAELAALDCVALPCLKLNIPTFCNSLGVVSIILNRNAVEPSNAMTHNAQCTTVTHSVTGVPRGTPFFDKFDLIDLVLIDPLTTTGQ